VRIARALPEDELPRAVLLLDRARKATPENDPAFRERLVAWATSAVKQDNGAKKRIWDEVQRHAPLFEDPACAKELRDAFAGLRVEG
jgi:hypothetical protein